MTGRLSSRFASQPLWRRRLIAGLTAYVLVLLALQALGFEPSPALFAALLVLVVTGAAYLDDRSADTQPYPWPVQSVPTTGLGRGADHRATSLARRLATISEAGDSARAALAHQLHSQLTQAVADRVRHAHGRDVLADAGAARELLPPDLAAFVSHPPDARQLTEPGPLARLLDRIESL